jgi:lipopolysaccharide export system protein LptC
VTTRRLVTTLALLALAVGVVQLLLWWLAPSRGHRVQAGPPRAAYVLQDFTLYSYGPDGKLVYRMQAPRLNRRQGDASLYLNQPSFLLASRNGSDTPPWTGQSDYGWVSANGDELKLQGRVELQRPAYPGAAAARIATRDLTAWPPQNRVATDARVFVHQGTATMTATGMRARLDTKHLELLHDFHGTFQPSTKPR